MTEMTEEQRKKFSECFKATVDSAISNFKRNKSIVPRYFVFSEESLVTIGVETIEKPADIYDAKTIQGWWTVSRMFLE